MLASAMVFSFTSCEKDPQQGTEKPAEKSKEAKILTFTATSGDVTIEGAVYENDKVVELVYLPEQAAALTNATAVATVSEKATISPDPATAADYTVEGGVKYTVTAEDGETTVEYAVMAVAATVQVKCEPVWEAPKTFGELGIANYAFSDGSVGFSGLNIVTHDCQVFDLDGNKVGTLNTTGLPNNLLVSLSNDVNGVFVATLGTKADGSAPANGDEIANSEFWAWKDGWDKAPVKIWEYVGANVGRYMSMSGDLAGDYIATIIAPGRGANGAMFHCFIGKGGQELKAEGVWHAFNTTFASNDGNWSQHVSAASGNPDGTFFIMDSQSGDAGVGCAFYARRGLEGDNVPLFGTAWPDELVAEEAHGGSNQYGNYTIAHVRGFMFNGVEYMIASSSGWPSSYITIQTPNAEDENHYLLRTQVFGTAEPKCSSAYVYDPATDTGHVIFAAANYQLVRYDITRQII